jgi:hypothetical protein
MHTEPTPPSTHAVEALRRFRLAATLTHGLPGAQLIVDDGRRERTVSRTHPADVPPCAFRRAVRAARADRTLAPVRELLDLDAETPLRCALTLGDPDVTDLGGGLFAIRSSALVGLVFATLLDSDATRRVACEAVRSSAPCDLASSAGHQPLRLSIDLATGVTVVMGQVAIDDPGSSGFVDRARAVAEACVVEELVLGV